MPLLALVSAIIIRLHSRVTRPGHDRGDVPGWVLVTMMTAMLVAGLWTFFQDALQGVFAAAMDTVMGG